jgi:hypothetical protein
LRFFTEQEATTARALLDRLLEQQSGVEPYVDVFADIDNRLALDVTDGWRYDDMPHDGEAWRASLQHLDADCRERFGCPLAAVGREQQMALVQAVQDLLEHDWHGLPARHVWSLWTRYACTAFYSHPWAWNEIGFPGPAYPRGYLNLGVDAREKAEPADRSGRDPVPGGTRRERAVEARARALVEDRQ